MAMREMYPGSVNSKQTELAQAINETQTSFTVLDGAVLPPAPNVLTLGTDESAETVLYTGLSGNTVSGVIRGFEGTAKSWTVGTKLARYFTAYDHNAFLNNILEAKTVADASLPKAGGVLTGPLRISSWGDISASSGGYVLYGHNCYLDAAGVVYRYRNTHANMGARGIVFRLGAGLQGALMFDMGAIATTAGASFTPILKRILNTDDYSAIVQDYIRQPGYAATTGTATAYVAALDPAPTSLPDGFGITIVPHVANGANPTLNVNGLGAAVLKDQKGVAYAAGKLVAGRPYTFRKVGSDFLADSGSSSGTAQPAQVLAGATFGNDNGDQVGTMPNNGAVTQNITTQNGTYTVPEGYHNGTGIVRAAITNLSAGNIKSGVSVGGVAGSFTGNSYVNNVLLPGRGSINIDVGFTYNSVFASSDANTAYWAFLIKNKKTYNNQPYLQVASGGSNIITLSASDYAANQNVGLDVY